jgi:hypothetical protein
MKASPSWLAANTAVERANPMAQNSIDHHIHGTKAGMQRVQTETAVMAIMMRSVTAERMRCFVVVMQV